ncbi:MAG TPA: hypothetical protein VGC76_01180 [Pyrinomonadaceae bacterium]|jgi:alpha-tubulin suppressor-like RCC1 family protein
MKRLFCICAFVLCGLLSFKTPAQVKSWGLNSVGQLGDTTTTLRNTPTPAFAGYTDITAFSGSEVSTLALRANGTILAVGGNSSGQLGDGTTTMNQCNCKTTPVVVRNAANSADLQNITAVSAGWLHSLALDRDGKVWAWGANYSGQLGVNSQNDSPLPVQVGAGVAGFDGQVIQIDAGREHNLALTADGKVWAWGANDFGQIGNGNTSVYPLVPVKVQASPGVDFTGVLQIAASSQFSMALRRDGTIWGWGNNNSSRIGNPAVTDVSVLYPAQTKQTVMGNVVQISAGNFHCVALTAAGEVWIWGHNVFGQLGNGSILPNPVAEPTKNTALSNIIEIKSETGLHNLVRDRAGQLFAWGANDSGSVGNGTFDNTVNTPYQITALGAGNAVIGTGRQHSLQSTPTIALAVGSQTIRGENVRLNFANVSGAGTLTYGAIDPTAVAGYTLPAGYTIQNNQPAYNVTATATYSGNVDVCITGINEYDATNFSYLKILHGEGSAWIDRTSSSTYVRGQICSRVTTLSPFVIARGYTPTSASPIVSGRVSSGKGTLSNRAIVTLTNAQGNVRTASVNPFGFYKFDNVAIGQTYTVQVSVKGATFVPQVITVNEDFENLDFSAQ